MRLYYYYYLYHTISKRLKDRNGIVDFMWQVIPNSKTTADLLFILREASS